MEKKFDYRVLVDDTGWFEHVYVTIMNTGSQTTTSQAGPTIEFWHDRTKLSELDTWTSGAIRIETEYPSDIPDHIALLRKAIGNFDSYDRWDGARGTLDRIMRMGRQVYYDPRIYNTIPLSEYLPPPAFGWAAVDCPVYIYVLAEDERAAKAAIAMKIVALPNGIDVMEKYIAAGFSVKQLERYYPRPETIKPLEEIVASTYWREQLANAETDKETDND